MQVNSFAQIQSQILQAVVALPDVPFLLNYNSVQHPGNHIAYQARIPLSGPAVLDGLQRIELDLEIAGQHFHEVFEPKPNLSYLFTWDGKTGDGQLSHGKQPLTIRTSFVYSGLEPSRTREATVMLGGWMVVGLGLGGWRLSAHHYLDILGRTLYTGDGSQYVNLDVEKADRINGLIAIPSGDAGLLYLFNEMGWHLDSAKFYT